MPTTESEPTARRRPGRPRQLDPSPEFLARREEIVATAAEVFRQKGYDAGTLEDVAIAMDLRRASLYHYVGSKSKLLFLIIDRGFDVAFAHLSQLNGIGDPVERLEALIRHQVTTVASQPDVFTVAFDHPSRLESPHLEEIRRREKAYFAFYQAAVEDAIKAGAIADIDPRYATHSLLGTLNWCYKWFQPNRDDLPGLIEACTELILGPGKHSTVKSAAPSAVTVNPR